MAKPSLSIDEAKALHQQHDLEGAVKAYRSLLKQDPHHLEACHLLGMALTQQEQFQAAEKCLRDAINNNPNQPSLHNSLANVLLRQNNMTDAIQTLSEALTIDETYATAHNTLGRCYYLQGQGDAAKQHYEQAIQYDTHFPQAHYNLALLHLQQEQWSQAVEQLQMTLKLNPDFHQAHRQLAEALLQLEDYPAAHKILLHCIESQPEHADNYYNLGLTYLKQQQPEEAVAAFEQAIALECEQTDIQHLLGNAYLHEGDPAKALSYFMRQLEVSPMMESYYNIGVILMHQDRNKEAIQYLEQAQSLAPDDTAIAINLGGIYLKLQQLDKATAHYQAAIEKDPDNDELKHIVAAISQGETPDHAPAEYVEHLFDQYAPYYDKHLTEALQFSVPQQLMDAVSETLESPLETLTPPWDILDIGCGTGLAAPFLKPLAKRLDGIDLSPQMIAVADSKALYDSLAVMDALTIAEHFSQQDLVIASDVFTYIGNLTTVLEQCQRVLNPQGLLAFSVERSEQPDYQLQTTIRYAHNKAYLESSLKQAGFKPITCKETTLRTQQKQPVIGYLVVAQLL